MPPFVLSADGLPATLDMDLANDRAALNGFVTPITSLLSCTRSAPTCFYTNAAGVMVPHGADTLRIGSAGLLVEAGSTNSLKSSLAMGTSPQWGNGGGTTLGASNVTTPAGSAAGQVITENTADSRHINEHEAINPGAGTHTWSCCFKDVDRGACALVVGTASGDGIGEQMGAYFNLANGTLAYTKTGVAAPANVSGGIRALSDGWYLGWITGTFVAATANYFAALCLSDRVTDTGNYQSLCPSYVGTSKSIVGWGAQFEPNKAYPTSLIETTSAAATRDADEPVFSDTSWSNLLSGTYYADVIVLPRPSVTGSPRIWGRSNTARCIMSANGNNTQNNTFDDGSVSLNATAGSGGFLTGAKIAVATSSGGGVAACMNAGTVATDADDFNFNSQAQNALGWGDGGRQIDGHLRRITYWNTRRSNAALQALTA